MEYVHGESLWKLARTAQERGERVPVGIAAAIVIDALRGLHAAHEARDERGEPLNLVHRDVSPHNIMVGADGVARLVDFGIAKAEGRLHSTRDSSVKGKYAYMAPEQARGEAVSRLSDTFAAAIVFWELLTGERLFAGKTDAETVHKCLVARVRRPSQLAPEVGPELDVILEKGLSRDPAARYATAEGMALDIEACVPAVRPSEVGDWVQRMAGDALGERARVVAALEAAGEPTAIPPAAPTVPRRRALWIVAASVAGAAGIAAAATLVVRGGTSTAAPVAVSSATSPATVAASAPPAPPPSATASSAPPPPIPTTPPTATATLVAPTSAASVVTRPPKSAAPVRVGRSSRPGCDPPYSIDSAGRQIFKPECMR
jgi:serine/threonine-protein kinase